LAAVHNLQPGVPPENIIALYTTGLALNNIFSKDRRR
jgi:hypothetical protein